jgi:hypothetical protein
MRATPYAAVLAAAAAVVAALTVAGCSSSTKGHVQAADGGNVAACADGRCEVAVAAGTAIAVPQSMAVQDLTLTEVSSDQITITAHDIGTTSNGTCSGPSVCHLSTDNGAVSATMGKDARLTENGLALTVVGIDGGTAVLKIEPSS